MYGQSVPAIDPDLSSLDSTPVHLRAGFVAVVLVGGAFGTLARFGLFKTLPAPAGFPMATFVTNLSGAFLLGILLEALVRRGADAGRLRLIRLGAGTGFMGAFTTYSTFALEAIDLGSADRLLMAAAYVAASIVGGIVLSCAGIWAASSHHRRTTQSQPNVEGTP